MSEKIAPTYSVWRSKSTKNLFTVLGFTAIPEVKQNGIIVGSAKKGVNVFSPEVFVDMFERIE